MRVAHPRRTGRKQSQVRGLGAWWLRCVRTLAFSMSRKRERLLCSPAARVCAQAAFLHAPFGRSVMHGSCAWGGKQCALDAPVLAGSCGLGVMCYQLVCACFVCAGWLVCAWCYVLPACVCLLSLC